MTEQVVVDDKIDARSPASSTSNGPGDNDDADMTDEIGTKTDASRVANKANGDSQSGSATTTKSPSSSRTSSGSTSSDPRDHHLVHAHHHMNNNNNNNSNTHHRSGSSPSTPDTSPDTSDTTNRNQFVAFHGLSQASLVSDHAGESNSSSYPDHNPRTSDPKDLAHVTSRDHSPDKPTVGSEEWLRVRRNNHKVVERRRRENINTGINELAKIVPQCDKNKGKILERAAQYIRVLKDQEAACVEKHTLEKLVMEQTIADLGSQNDKLRVELEKSWKELAALRKDLDARSDNV